MENIFNKDAIIQKLIKYLSEAKYFDQFKVDERLGGRTYPSSSYSFIAGKVKYSTNLFGETKKTFERKYDLTLEVVYPNVPLLLLFFYKFFKLKFYIHIKIVNWNSFFGETISIEKSDFDQLHNIFIENYKRVLKETLDNSSFDNEPNIFEESNHTTFKSKKISMKDYLLKKLNDKKQ